MKKTTKFEKILAAFCSKKAVDASQVRFVYDGTRVNPSMTPEDLDMEDGDTVRGWVWGGGRGCQGSAERRGRARARSGGGVQAHMGCVSLQDVPGRRVSSPPPRAAPHRQFRINPRAGGCVLGADWRHASMSGGLGKLVGSALATGLRVRLPEPGAESPPPDHGTLFFPLCGHVVVFSDPGRQPESLHQTQRRVWGGGQACAGTRPGQARCKGWRWERVWSSKHTTRRGTLQANHNKNHAGACVERRAQQNNAKVSVRKGREKARGRASAGRPGPGE